MDLLGVGPLELIFVFILVILVFGPQDLIKAGKSIGRFLNKVVKSEGWQAIQDVNREIKAFPDRLVREAGLEEPLSEVLNGENSPPLKQTSEKRAVKPKAEEDIIMGIKAWTTPPEDNFNQSETEQEGSLE